MGLIISIILLGRNLEIIFIMIIYFSIIFPRNI